MVDDTNFEWSDRFGSVAGQVEQLWRSVENPVLVCALRIDHTLTKASEEVGVVISEEGGIIYRSAFNPVLGNHHTTTNRLERSSADFTSRIRSLLIFDLGSVLQPMYDGSTARIAIKDTDRTNFFTESSINTPQARVREAILALADEAEFGNDPGGSGQASACSECEMDFVVTLPKTKP